MLAHEFVLVTNVPAVVSLRDFDRKKMIIISDDFFLQYNNENTFGEIDTCWEEWGNMSKGFAYWGTTILNVEMAQKVLDVVLRLEGFDTDRKKLTRVLRRAIAENKFVIHFGV